jgi:hypothetical protein
VAELGARISDLRSKMTEIQLKAREEGRDLQASEQRRVDRFDAEAEACEQAVAQARKAEEAYRRVPYPGSGRRRGASDGSALGHVDVTPRASHSAAPMNSAPLTTARTPHPRSADP